MKLAVGFAGMGIMGKAMARNAAKAGHHVAVYNRSPLASGDAEGLEIAATPLELARCRDVLVLMLTGPGAVDAVLWGENGMGPALGPGKTVVNMSTVPPAYCASLAGKLGAAGAVFVDAPVSGSKVPAQQGALVILAGGPRDAVDALEPLFMSMGKKVVYCGEAPKGSMMKMSVNLLLASMMESLCEMLVFGRAGGLTDEAMLQVALGGPLACDLFKVKEQMLLQRKFPAQFPLKHMHKDLRFVTDTATDMRCPAPSAFANLQIFNQAMSKGLGELDFAAVIEALEGMV
ncbi:2-hydroxy-3-oxopropionate reductase [Fundidesulfovibrio magnetotacticus]|uniref:2-hydroxy-3-oxopropionate reductase n=1 Tax=Fundidesulfovibrio magnetotacticus TaxID=2730080 RepID=A0A6V8LQP8_9BACT|nr:NAD(P)-dependent oxidoreductase [Fundidesulfovibrio magnetotacticus]GFK94054.1 2-hydroxy-3-oxopropionate reductase [Fundidesulfovibrio magnetotacticus]